MDNSKLVKADSVLRWIHLYTGLFLLPWMLVYGASAFCLNHNRWLINQFNVMPLIVEKQKSFSFYRLIHFLHFRGGYSQPYFVNITWAVIVDAVAISMWLWAFSGVYLWWRRSRRILLGWACLIVGVLSFLGLVLLFCR